MKSEPISYAECSFVGYKCNQQSFTRFVSVPVSKEGIKNAKVCRGEYTQKTFVEENVLWTHGKGRRIHIVNTVMTGF